VKSLAAVALVVALASGTAFAHEVLHTVERGRAIAIKAYFADGEPMAYTEFAVFAPGDAKIPYQKGRTDRSGYLAFVPGVAGSWHVKVTGTDGHGLDLDVAVDGTNDPTKSAQTSSGLASWIFVARPLVGVALIAALFVVLMLLYRKKGLRR
jgi:nickel transport protein